MLTRLVPINGKIGWRNAVAFPAIKITKSLQFAVRNQAVTVRFRTVKLNIYLRKREIFFKSGIFKHGTLLEISPVAA